MKTAITVRNPDLFNRQLDGINQSFGDGALAVAEVTGYQLFEDDGGFIGGGTGDPKADRLAITSAFSKWNPTALADGKPLLLQIKIRLLPNGPSSGWLSVAEAWALAFPNKA